MSLANTRLGREGGLPLLLAHGILGSRRNWRSFARRLVDARPDLDVVLLDLRGHGDSAPGPAPHTVDACADDVLATARALGLRGRPVLVGHSFGGKVMATAAERWPEPVAQLWVLDAPLGTRDASFPEGPAEVEAVVATLRRIPLPLADRQALLSRMSAEGFGPALGQWMTTNLRRAGSEGYVWRFDLDTIEALLADYFARDRWPGFSVPRGGAQHHLVRGARSSRWSEADRARLAALHRSGRARDHVLADAGHWLHADNPEGLLALLLDGLPPPQAD